MTGTAHRWCAAGNEELRSIVHYGRFNLTIDLAFFPNQRSSPVWSSSPETRGTLDEGFPIFAWFINIASGGDGFGQRSYGRRVRLVRGGQ